MQRTVTQQEELGTPSPPGVTLTCCVMLLSSQSLHKITRGHLAAQLQDDIANMHECWSRAAPHLLQQGVQIRIGLSRPCAACCTAPNLAAADV